MDGWDTVCNHSIFVNAHVRRDSDDGRDADDGRHTIVNWFDQSDCAQCITVPVDVSIYKELDVQPVGG